MYVFADDYSRFLFADILPDQTSWSAAIALDEALVMMPFDMQVMYSDNGKEFKKAFLRAQYQKGHHTAVHHAVQTADER